MHKISNYFGEDYIRAVEASFERKNDLVVVRNVFPQQDIDGILVNPSHHAEYFGQTALASQISNPFTTKLIPIFDQRATEDRSESFGPEIQKKRIDGELTYSAVINLSAPTVVLGKRIAGSEDTREVIDEQYEKWQTGSGELLNGTLVRCGDGAIIPRGVVYAIQGLGVGKSLVVNTKKK